MFATLRQRIVPLARVSRVAIAAAAVGAATYYAQPLQLETRRYSVEERLKPRPPLVIKTADAKVEEPEPEPEPEAEQVPEPEAEPVNEPQQSGEETDDETNQSAYDERTGEINWDCPCLGGMAHGPCGEEFKQAFSCFVFSEADPKGMDCIDKFKMMQDCFRRHPEVYADELAADEAAENETSSAGKEN